MAFNHKVDLMDNCRQDSTFLEHKLDRGRKRDESKRRQSTEHSVEETPQDLLRFAACHYACDYSENQKISRKDHNSQSSHRRHERYCYDQYQCYRKEDGVGCSDSFFIPYFRIQAIILMCVFHLHVVHICGAAEGILCDSPDMGEHVEHQKHEHDRKDQKTEPDVLDRIGSYDLRCQKHGERVGHGPGKAESACYCAAEKAGKRIKAHRQAQGSHNRKHGEHLFEQPKERTEAVEEKRYQNKKQGPSFPEPGRDGIHNSPDSTYIVHNLECGGDEEQKQGKDYQGCSVGGQEHQNRCQDSTDQGYSSLVASGCVLKVVHTSVWKDSEVSLRHDVGQYYGE